MKLKNIVIIFFIIAITLINSVCYANIEEPNLTAGAAILIDSSTGKTLYSKNETQKMYPASTTKIMTAILTIENSNLDDIVTVSYDNISSIPSGYSVASLQHGEQLTVKQLLQLMMVHSANDAANVLAYYISGSIESFSIMMNNKVAELGLKNTHFTNPSGMHDENHYTTAYDLSFIMKYCMENPTFRSLAGLKSCTIPATNKYEERVFSTTNELLIYDTRNVESNYYYKYAIAGKTGYTTEAKNCLVSVANKDDLELISVILSVGVYNNEISAKFVESRRLLEYGYNNYTIRKLREQNAIATSVEVPNATEDTKNLDLLTCNDITVLINQEYLDSDFSPEIKINENLYAPISEGEIVGTLTYNIDGISYSTNLKASHSVQKSTFSTLVVQIFLVIFIIFLLYKLIFDSDPNKNNYMRKKRKKNKRKNIFRY